MRKGSAVGAARRGAGGGRGVSDGARGSKGRDGTGRRVERGQGRGSPRAGGGRSTEMINASKSPPFASPTYLPTYLPYLPARAPPLSTYLSTYLPTSRDLDPRALSKFSTSRGSGRARPLVRIMPRTLRGRNFPSVRSFVRTLVRSPARFDAFVPPARIKRDLCAAR